MWLFDVAWQFPNWIRLNLACRPITSYNVCPSLGLLQDLPGDVPSAIQRQEEKRMHTMLVKENTDRIPGKDSLRCDATMLHLFCKFKVHAILTQICDTTEWKQMTAPISYNFICFIANGLPEVHAGLTRFITILMRLSGLIHHDPTIVPATASMQWSQCPTKMSTKCSRSARQRWWPCPRLRDKHK